ncbi:MAG: C1 family peptidase [Phycisphaerae bacterium]
MRQSIARWVIIAMMPAASHSCADAEDRAVWREYPDAFKQRLRERIEPATRPAEREMVLMLDSSAVHAPRSPADFKQAWHQPPVSQGLTGQCWGFSATSFLESEVHRRTGRELRLSFAYTYYWEYVEKAREFVRTRGQSVFNRGSEPDAVPRIWRRHGIVPAETYRGLPAGHEVPQDAPAHREIAAYLADVKANGRWDESEVVATARRILDKHLGHPPKTVTTDGKAMTPQEYVQQIVRLDLDDYVSIMSTMQAPYDGWSEFNVIDNWWHSRRYYNVRLDDFVKVIRHAARTGRTVCLGIDNTEPGYCFREGLAVVPTFDIPPVLIDDGARQMRLSNESTSDDHDVHLVGWLEKDGQMWYLIKDSGTKAWNNSHNGYMFYREDYVRLKALCALLSRDIIEQALGRGIGMPPGDH